MPRVSPTSIVRTLKYVHASDIFTPAELETIGECASNVTWGDANYTMVTADNEMFDEVRENNETLDDDLRALKLAETYIDMEN